VSKVNSPTVRKYCIQFPVCFPTHNLMTLSPQPFTSHHFTTHINFSHKVSFLPPSLHFTSLHFTSLHFTSLRFHIRPRTPQGAQNFVGESKIFHPFRKMNLSPCCSACSLLSVIPNKNGNSKGMSRME